MPTIDLSQSTYQNEIPTDSQVGIACRTEDGEWFFLNTGSTSFYKLIAGANIEFEEGVDADGNPTLEINGQGGGGGVDITPTTQRWVRFLTSAGSGDTLKSEGSPAVFPSLDFHNGSTNIWDTPSALHIDTNPTRRVFANPIIDQLMRLDNLTGEYQCRFFATHIKRNMTNTPMVINQRERIFQYGSQGDDELNPDGGWVARINSSSNTPQEENVFPPNSVAFAIHTTWNPDVPKPGSQLTASFPDPIAVTRPFTDAEWEAGIDFVFVVDDSATPFRGHIFYTTINDSEPQVVTDIHQQSEETWPLPGMSTNGPGDEQSSNGFVLFNQSVDYVQTNTSPLKDSDISNTWIGTARDYIEILDIVDFHHNNPNGDLSTLLT